eukprot:2206423-Amphidinium_carterae.1
METFACLRKNDACKDKWTPTWDAGPCVALVLFQTWRERGTLALPVARVFACIMASSKVSRESTSRFALDASTRNISSH